MDPNRCSRPARTTTPRTSRRLGRYGVIAVAALGLGALGACGSDGDDDAATGTGAFCEAVADYAEAVRSGDRTSMASALEGSTADLPEDAARTVDAYIDTLTAAPPNQDQDQGDVEERTAEVSFRSYASEACGADSIPAVDATSTPPSPDSTTTTSEPQADPAPTTTGPGNSRNEPDDGGGQDDRGPADDSESYPSDTQPSDTEPG
jgi:hypothetical protein